MESWQSQLSDSIVKVEDLPFVSGDSEYRKKLEQVAEIFPIRINSYFKKLIKEENDPLWRQVVPTIEELDDLISLEETLESDPLHEEEDMPVPELVHRYPDRVLLMLNNQCPIICRFCTRKRKIGFPGIVTREPTATNMLFPNAAARKAKFLGLLCSVQVSPLLELVTMYALVPSAAPTAR